MEPYVAEAPKLLRPPEGDNFPQPSPESDDEDQIDDEFEDVVLDIVNDHQLQIESLQQHFNEEEH